MGGPKAVDIRELARRLNVSIGTVSRALNGRAGVNPETRRRVVEAAVKLNYAPNQSGRSLRKGTTHAVAFLLQPHPGDHPYSEPFFVQFLKGLQAGLAERGLELIMVMDSPGVERERLRRVVEARWADATILAWTRRRDPRIDYLSEAGFPFATLGRSLSGGSGYPSLDLDFMRAGEEAVARLAVRGHRRIGVVSPPTELNFAHLFRRGYRQGLSRARLPFDRALIAAGEVNEAGGYAAARDLMTSLEPPTAILFNNDAMAFGGYRALRDLGFQPGRDVAAIVTVDGALCDYLSPALTGFSVELEPLGRRLAEILLAAMPPYAGPDGPRIIREVWPLALTPRESDSPRVAPVHNADAFDPASKARDRPFERGGLR
jgi:DNA-binding LacI/PurR family transcriptional regulator